MKEKENKLSLLNRWKNKKEKETSTTSILKVPKDERVPLSYGQQQLWFLQQLYPNNPFYNYSEVYDLIGKLEVNNFKKALRLVIRDHEIFSTSIHIHNEDTHQKVNTLDVEIPYSDLSQLTGENLDKKLKELSTSNAIQSFYLSQAPLFALQLIKIAENKHRFLITMHHIITDKWSMNVFRKSLSYYYNQLQTKSNPESIKPSTQYSDFAFWQKRQTLDESQINYWSKKLEKAPSYLDIPLDFSRPLKPSFRGALHKKEYSANLSKRILDLAKDLQTTPYVLLLTVYNILLFKYSGQSDILIGSPISNRNDKSLENLVGYFNDTVVLRNTIKSDMDFLSVFKNVKADVLDSFSNKDIPFDTLVKKLKPERISNVNPFFQVMFLFHSVPKTPSFGPELSLQHEPIDIGVSKFDLTLYIAEDNDVLSTTFEYATDIFSEKTILRLQTYYYALLEAILDNPNEKISKLSLEQVVEEPIPTISVKNEVVDFISTVDGIHELIENQAINNPDAIAVCFKDEKISYSDLNKRANVLAKHILAKSNGRNEIVGLLLPRSIELIVGILGILKAGCGYLPLDPEYPVDRLTFMLKDSEVKLMVTNNQFETIVAIADIDKVFINHDHTERDKSVVTLPKIKRHYHAYVIYTSGSTGKPKGVPVSHDNILHSTQGRVSYYEDNPSSFLLLSSIAFDSSKAGLFWTLCKGGKLVVSEDKLEQDVERLCETIYNEKVTHTLMLPSLYYVILQFANIELLRFLKTVIVAGEACSEKMVERHFNELDNVNLYNEYGPTEATVWCIAHKIKKEDVNGIIPIGVPVANSQISLYDNQMNLVPKGAVGEIHVGGPGLTKGYLNRQELTDKVFIDKPNSENGIKIYKTGDLARYNPNGHLEFLGRKDLQIKIRGHRIELDEIKNLALKEGNILDAEACVVNVNNMDQIHLFVAQNDTEDNSNLKAILNKKLPKYMMPSKITALSNFPKLPNGKNDLEKLRTIKPAAVAKPVSKDNYQSLTIIQEKLIEIWSKVLNQKNIGINDNFFEVGGDSILSIQIISGARKMGLDFSPNELFENQTIAELEKLIIKSKKIVKESRNSYVGSIGLSPIQKWFFETHKNAPHYWNQAFVFDNDLEIAIANVKKAFNYVIKHHDALRTRFYIEESDIRAEIPEYEELLGFETFQITGKNQIAIDNQVSSILEKVQQNTSLDKGALFKCLYFENKELNSSKFVLLSHHLVIDVVSWQIVLNDFKAVLNIDERSVAAVRTSSVKDWIDYLNELSESKELSSELAFWQSQYVDHNLPIDLKGALPVKEAFIETIEYVLDKETTRLLTTIANEAYNTKTDELLLTAFSTALCQFSGAYEMSVALEKHGRETLNTNFDLSNTVGWFTSFFPVKIQNSLKKDYATDITNIKERLRNVPNGGIGFGILKYLSPALKSFEYPKVVFNFLGVNAETDYKFIGKGVRGSLSERNYLLEANLQIQNEKLVMMLSYSSEIYQEKTIKNLIAQFDTSINEIVAHCQGEEGKFTPSDFPELDMNQDDLDDLLGSLEF